MLETLHIDPEKRKVIENGVRTESHMCWTCGSCVTECPVNIATNRLDPRKIVWMANLGLLDELVGLPEIWYCQTCNRCNQVCPMTVKPSALIAFLRLEAVGRGLVPFEALRQFKALFCRFHQARWSAASTCLRGGDIDTPPERSGELLDASFEVRPEDGAILDLFSGSADLREAIEESELSCCHSCGECSSGCPVCCRPEVFDPRRIFRLANLGLSRELLSSPSIWLCLGCRRCTGGCSQNVAGHQMIRRIQELALRHGFVDERFLSCWQKVSRRIYSPLLEEIDRLLDFPRSSAGEALH